MELAGMVLLPVPMEFATRLAELRDRLIAGSLEIGNDDERARRSGSDDDRVVEVPGQGRWTESMLRRLDDRLTYPLVRELFERCASRPGQWVSKAEIDEVGGVGPYQLRNELSALSKLTRRVFDEMIWPMEWMKTDEGFLYRMPKDMAAMWSSVTSDHAGLAPA